MEHETFEPCVRVCVRCRRRGDKRLTEKRRGSTSPVSRHVCSLRRLPPRQQLNNPRCTYYSILLQPRARWLTTTMSLICGFAGELRRRCVRLIVVSLFFSWRGGCAHRIGQLVSASLVSVAILMLQSGFECMCARNRKAWSRLCSCLANIRQPACTQQTNKSLSLSNNLSVHDHEQRSEQFDPLSFAVPRKKLCTGRAGWPRCPPRRGLPPR